MTRRHALFLVALWSAAGGIRSALAQREPVLKQVAVPHAYYWREMYVPQVTSGPSAVTWSPDGTELIYSMQGSLWRQRKDQDRKSTRLNSSHPSISYAVFCLKKKKKKTQTYNQLYHNLL